MFDYPLAPRPAPDPESTPSRSLSPVNRMGRIESADEVPHLAYSQIRTFSQLCKAMDYVKYRRGIGYFMGIIWVFYRLPRQIALHNLGSLCHYAGSTATAASTKSLFEFPQEKVGGHGGPPSFRERNSHAPQAVRETKDRARNHC